MEHTQTPEMTIKAYPANLDIFVDGDYIHHLFDGHAGVYTRNEYTELLQERYHHYNLSEDQYNRILDTIESTSNTPFYEVAS